MNEARSQIYPPLQPFARLIGNWKLRHCDLNTKEEWDGHDTFEWLPGGRFLTFRHHEGGTANIDGIMVIGNEMGWEQTQPGDEIIGHWFQSDGHHYKYVWEINGDSLQFWLNDKQSGMAFKGTFSKDGNTISGTWKWPGGGYDLVMQRA